jgi:hypothetical protein
MKSIIEHFREGTVGVLLLSALAGGLAFDLGSAGVEHRQETPIGGVRFEERALFCPPPPARKSVTAKLTMASESGEDLLVEVSPQQPEPSTLDGGHTRVVDVGDPADVIGRGGPVFAGATNVYSKPVAGAGAARCSRTASSRWYFGEGSSLLGFDESLLIYNPFPDEAVVRVVFFTNVGESAKANLADVGIPAGEWRAIRVNEFILRQRTLAASVVAVRGRVVSWRAATVKGGGASGAQFSLGSPTADDIWYLPAGAVGEGISQRIAVLNPSEEEAVVTVQLVTDDETLQPPKLVDLVIPARSSRSISLARSVTGRQVVEGGVGAIVRSTNGTDIVVEGTVSYDTRLLEGVASEMGVQEPEADWLLGPAAVASETDGAVLLNPGGEPASVSIELWFRDGEPRRPAALQDLEVRAGTRMRVHLQKWTGSQPVVAVVASDVPIVAGRTASTSSDVATVMGLPAATRSER